MDDRLDSIINGLLKNELMHIVNNTIAVLKPQSKESKKIYSLYCAITSKDRDYNRHISNASEEYDIEEVIIPSFKKYVITQLTEHGYNKDRFKQLMLNDMNRFENDDQFDPRFDKYMDDMQSICSHSKTIAKSITKNDMAMVEQEVSTLKSRFETFFPTNRNDILEVKPNFMGIGLNFNAIYRQIKSWLDK